MEAVLESFPQKLGGANYSSSRKCNPGYNKVREQQIMATRQISRDKLVICQNPSFSFFQKILLFSSFLHQPSCGDSSSALEILILCEPNLMFSTLKFSIWKDQKAVPDLLLSHGFFHTKSPFQCPTSVCCQHIFSFSGLIFFL